MPLIVLGVNHHVVGVEELAALTPVAGEAGPRIAAAPGIRGALVLSTCNRFEVYLDSERFHEGVETAVAVVSELAGPRADAAVAAFEVRAGQGAVEHTFAVAAGLDSMVIGESEISGQVRGALAASHNHLSPRLQRLFQAALATSKTVASRTQLGQAGRSVASVALDLADARHGRLAQRRVLILGTGAFARVVVADLSRRGCTDIWVHSATGRAGRFAATHPVSPVPAGRLSDAVARAELIVACSGTGHPVLTAKLVEGARFGADGALPVIDLSLGRDVEPAAAAIPGVDVINLDTVGQCAPAEGATQVLAARNLVEQAVATFMHIEGGRAADPAVIAMRGHIMGIIEAEIDLVARRYPEDVAAAVAQSLRRVSNELMHTPSVRAHELARTGELEDYRRAMRTLFGIAVTDDNPAEVR